jgi:hypothetical protein
MSFSGAVGVIVAVISIGVMVAVVANCGMLCHRRDIED